jgi:hypothetical protein
MTTRLILAAAVTLGLASPAWAGTPDQGPKHPLGINARQHRQAERIAAGKKSGELTRSELDRLRGEEAAIRAKERAYRASGGDLSKREFRDLQRDLDRLSREIFRLTHNGRGKD